MYSYLFYGKNEYKNSQEPIILVEGIRNKPFLYRSVEQCEFSVRECFFVSFSSVETAAINGTRELIHLK